jgi:signal transduction histidine kinase
MWMLMVMWRVLVKVLRHISWGILLVPVAAMGIVLFGLNLWTFGAVLAATIVAVQWPAAAGRLLPPTMVGAGVSGLVVAGRISGSPVSWFVRSIGRFTKSQAVVSFPKGGPAGPGWVVTQSGGGLQVSFSPRAFAAMRGAVANARAKGKRVFLPRQVIARKGVIVPQKQAPPPKVIASQSLHGNGSQTITFNGPLPGQGRAFTATQRIPPGAFAKAQHLAAARPSWAVRGQVFAPAGLWHGRLLVPVALLLLTLGLWLIPRTLAGVRGQGTTLAPEVWRWLVENRWGVLLVPVTLLGLTVFGVRPWTIAAVIAAVILLARWPRVAGDLVPVVLAILAVRGFQLAANWQSMAAAFQGPAFGRPPVPSPVQFGAVFVDSPTAALLAGVEASVFLAFGAWLVPRTIGAHARTVFTPGSDLELAGRVQRLTESRSHAVDTATTELRRIERDLHDGAQARLVALGMNLRAVERVLPVNPNAALALVAEARESSVRALNELRDLIRGICPPVLADRGLGHAIRALALDTPLPTELDIDLPGRLSAPVESACYFAVAEALANAVKHSGARRVQIRIRHAADILRIEVADDGVGGADPARGTGLQGVERRLGTFDGILAVSSPPGGPTMIVMEVPCALSSPKIYSC